MKAIALLPIFFACAAVARAQDAAVAPAQDAPVIAWRAAVTGGLLSQEKFTGLHTDDVGYWGAELGYHGTKTHLEVGYAFDYALGINGHNSSPGAVGYNAAFHTFFANYYLKKQGLGFYFGPQAGVVRRSLTATASKIAMSSGFFGARAGYNYPLGKNFSAGAQLQYLYAKRAKETVSEGNMLLRVSLPETHFLKYLLLLNYSF